MDITTECFRLAKTVLAVAEDYGLLSSEVMTEIQTDIDEIKKRERRKYED